MPLLVFRNQRVVYTAEVPLPGQGGGLGNPIQGAPLCDVLKGFCQRETTACCPTNQARVLRSLAAYWLYIKLHS